MSDDVKRIRAPFDEATARSLRAGDRVLISGTILAARDAAHKRLTETLARGESLPVDLRGQVVYYVGPSPASPGHVIGSAGPTTSGRMDAYTPTLIGQGLRGMIGKGYRKPEVVEAMKAHGVPYLAAVGGAGALRCRLLDMGLTPRTCVTLRKVAPMGDPIEIRVRGYELTLRVEDAQKITVEAVEWA